MAQSNQVKQKYNDNTNRLTSLLGTKDKMKGEKAIEVNIHFSPILFGWKEWRELKVSFFIIKLDLPPLHFNDMLIRINVISCSLAPCSAPSMQ